MNKVTATPTGLQCSCGAKCDNKDKNRFNTRHPKTCSERRAFNERLARGTRSVETSQEENVDLYRLGKIEAEGRGLTEWERTFVADIRKKVDACGTSRLTENQKTHLERVYADRT